MAHISSHIKLTCSHIITDLWFSFLENDGKMALIHRALCGGKSTERDFRNHLRSCMHHNEFKSGPDYPDVWMRTAIKSDGTKVYEYVLL
jgi:hypothetical protein